MRGKAAVLLLVLTACAARGPGVVFAPASGPGAQERADPLPHVLWLERVALAEPAAADRELAEVALTYNLARYLSGRELFQRVRVLPGSPEPGDWVATFRIERARERARSTVGGTLYSLVTLGFGGLPSMQLDIDLAGAVEIRDGRGQPVAASRAEHRADLKLQPRQFGAHYTFFLDERSRWVDKLLEDLFEKQGKTLPAADVPRPADDDEEREP